MSSLTDSFALLVVLVVFHLSVFPGVSVFFDVRSFSCFFLLLISLTACLCVLSGALLFVLIYCFRKRTATPQMYPNMSFICLLVLFSYNGTCSILFRVTQSLILGPALLFRDTRHIVSLEAVSLMQFAQVISDIKNLSMTHLSYLSTKTLF